MRLKKSIRPPKSLIVILGPTAVGKSALALQLAQEFRGQILSADSRQVYRDMNLGTGKVSRADQRLVQHHLLDIASPQRQYTVARFVRDAHRVIARTPMNQPIFLVGGSAFYIDAVLRPGSFSPVPPNPVLRRRLGQKTTPQLIALLKKKDPERLKTIDLANRRRLIRAIEISSAKLPPLPKTPTLDLRVIKIGLRLPNAALFKRIDLRVDARLRQGMIAEVKKLHQQGVSWKRLDEFGLEYRFLSRYLRGQLKKSEAITQLKSATHDFARRQMTWWRRDTDIHWVKTKTEAKKLTRVFLRESTVTDR